MFGLPSLINLPVFGVFAGGTIELPMLGAIVGWFLIAAMIGSALGVLRGLGRTETPAASSKVGFSPFYVAPPVDVQHKEAA